LITPTQSHAGEMWEAVKQEWELRPWALFLAAPVFIATAPFMLFKVISEKLEDDDD
jgi:hypothetical protein